MPTSVFVFVTWLFLAAACSSDPSDLREWRPEDHGQPAQPSGADLAQAPPAAPEDPAAAEQRAILALWNVTCASCHGRDGRGGGPALPPGTVAPNFADSATLAERSDAQLAEVITNGRGMMPGFGKQVSASGIAALVKHVRTLSVSSAGGSETGGEAAPAP